MSIQDRARLIAQYIEASPEQRKLILDHAKAVDAVTPLGPRLVDEIRYFDYPAAA